MASRYFDANGTTSGFGTLTGNWNAAGPTIGWSSSAAGTGAVEGFAFTNADEAIFGAASATATAGMITIPSIDVTVNKITTANISGTQILTYAGPGSATLTLAGTTPTFTINSALRINAPFNGTSAVTKAGTADLWFGGTHNASTFSSTFTISAGVLLFGTDFNNAGPTANQLPNATGYVVNSTLRLLNSTNPGFTITAPISGSGEVFISAANTAVAPTNAIRFADMFAFTGSFALWSNQISSNYCSIAEVVKLQQLGTISYVIGALAVDGSRKLLTIPSTAVGHTTSAAIIVKTDNNYAVTNTTYAFYASQGSGAMTLNGPITRQDPGGFSNVGPLTFTLGGTNTAANTVNGVISSASGGVFGLAKVDAGLWVLSGNNTYSGGTTISGGTLRGTNSAAFGTGSITMSGSPVLELSGDITVANTHSNAIGTIRGVSGANTLSGGIALAGTTAIDVTADSLTLSGLITGSTALSKTGTGLATLSNTANGFSSSPTISDGTLAVPAFSALGTGTALTLSGAGTLRYTGSNGGTLSRTVIASNITGGFENTGNSNIAITGSGSPSGTVKLGSASDGTGQYNTLALAVEAGSNGFTKAGPGRWISTGGNDLTGITAVNGGTLMAANANGATNKLLGGTVTVAAGAKIQTGSDNGQLGKNHYTNLTFNGTSGNPARIRIGGSAVNPTIYMAGILTIPSGGMTWDISGDTFKSKGTYTLVEFGPSGSLSGDVNDVTLTKPTGFEGRTYTLAYNSSASPKTITVTIS